MIHISAFHRNLFVCVFAFMASMSGAQMPTKITEHWWLDPGPEQSEEGAPRVLVVYPMKKEPSVGFAQQATRFAGRVDPEDAEVTLNGTPVEIYKGGVFTGLIPLAVGKNVVEIKATKDGKTTTIEREVVRNDRINPPSAWPLEFRKGTPISPAGKFGYWLRPGSKLKVKCYASPGHKAFARVGEKGEWLAMKEVAATEDQGGAYEHEIVVDDSYATSEQKLQFKIEGSEKADGPSASKTMTSDLKIRKLAMDEIVVGEVTSDFATFLKNPEGFERYGNWNKGVRFPIWERFSDRVSVNHAVGESGYIEVEAMKVLEKGTAFSPPNLGSAKVVLDENELDAVRLEFTSVSTPPCVFVHDLAETSERLTVHLLGGAIVSGEAASHEVGKVGEAGYSRRNVEVREASETEPASVIVDFANRKLWGYGWSQPAKGQLALTIRLKPVEDEKKRPLDGWRIMVDAGHGGSDTGALGPSGLREADVNLVLAAMLGERLKKLGATIQQTRLADVKVELDDRVRMAEKFNADLFVSVHHNSVALQTDPLKDKGPKLFYHYPHSVPLADALEAQLVGLITPGEPARVYKEVFRVMRNITFCPSVLVEGGFVCHPEDEILLRDSAFLEKMADALAQGVVETIQR